MTSPFPRDRYVQGAPYRDYEVSIPRSTSTAIKGSDGGSFRSATVNLMISQFALDIVVWGLIDLGLGEASGFLEPVLGLPSSCYPFIYLRLDLLSVESGPVGAFACLQSPTRPRWAGALLAVACFAKIWPLALSAGLLVRAQPEAHLAPFATVASAGIAGMGLDCRGTKASARS